MKTKNGIIKVGIVCFLSLANVCLAQTDNSQSGGGNSLPSNTGAFGKGSNILSVGVGVGGNYAYYYNGYASTPNLVLSYDNGTFGNVGPGTISLGGLLSYKGISYDYTDFHNGYTYDQNWYYYIIGFRSAYHWNFTNSSRFDPYIGLMLAYYYIGYKATSNDPYFGNPHYPDYYYYSNAYSSYTALSLYLGARYYVSNRVGLWLELGFGYSNAALGVSFKL